MFDRLWNAVRPTRTADRRGRRRQSPEVAALEVRSLMTVNLNLFPGAAARYVTEVYVDLLQRTPAIGELNFNVAHLQNGETPDQFAHKIIVSTEHRALQVTQWYQTYLGRNPEPAGLAYQVNLLKTGGSPTDTQLGMILSPEFQKAHVSDASYVDALYVDVLHRTAAPEEEAYWVGKLAGGQSRKSLAAGFLNSREYLKNEINADFNLVLHRNASGDAIQTWADEIRGDKGTDDHLLVALFGSDENLNNVRLGKA